jgi:hypothetical protein
MLERSAFPHDLVPATAPGQATAPWIVVHFGERRWITGEADGCADALRLAVCTGEGGVQIDAVAGWRHRRGGTDPSRVRLWTFPLSAAGHAALLSGLRGWIAPGVPARPLGSGASWYESCHPWSLGRNCHDFTVSILAAGGVDVDRDVIMQADPLRQALDQAWQVHDESLGRVGRR